MAGSGGVGFSAELFASELRSERFGRAAWVVGETSSTVDVARRWLRDGEPEGGVVIAERQTEGRGRHGRSWASPLGGLWMSLIVRPGIEAERAGLMGIGLALAAAEAVWAEAECEVGVKWPNDLVIADKKVGGVLVGAAADGSRITEAVLSLGLNANLRLGDLPPEVQDTATTLLEETGREHGLEALAARTLEHLEERWEGIVGGGDELAEDWRRRDVLIDREVAVVVGEDVLRGRASGIDRQGALVLVAEDRERKVRSGEVMSVRTAGDGDT